MDYQGRKAQANLGKHVTYHQECCPKATQDVHENTKNRDWTCDNFGYGPMNPDFPNDEFWEKKADGNLSALRSVRLRSITLTESKIVKMSPATPC